MATIKVSSGFAAKLKEAEPVAEVATSSGKVLTTQPQAALTQEQKDVRERLALKVPYPKSIMSPQPTVTTPKSTLMPTASKQKQREAYIEGETKGGFLEEARSKVVTKVYGEDIGRTERAFTYDVFVSPYRAAADFASRKQMDVSRSGEGQGTLGTNVAYFGASAAKGGLALWSQPLTTTAEVGAIAVAGAVAAPSAAASSIFSTTLGGTLGYDAVSKRTTAGVWDPVGGIGETAGMIAPFALGAAAPRPKEFILSERSASSFSGVRTGKKSAYDFAESTTYSVGRGYDIFGKKVLVESPKTASVDMYGTTVRKGKLFDITSDFKLTDTKGKRTSGMFAAEGQTKGGKTSAYFEYRYKDAPRDVYFGNIAASQSKAGRIGEIRLFEVASATTKATPVKRGARYELLTGERYMPYASGKKTRSYYGVEDIASGQRTATYKTSFGNVEITKDTKTYDIFKGSGTGQPYRAIAEPTSVKAPKRESGRVFSNEGDYLRQGTGIQKSKPAKNEITGNAFKEPVTITTTKSQYKSFSTQKLDLGGISRSLVETRTGTKSTSILAQRTNILSEQRTGRLLKTTSPFTFTGQMQGLGISTRQKPFQTTGLGIASITGQRYDQSYKTTQKQDTFQMTGFSFGLTQPSLGKTNRGFGGAFSLPSFNIGAGESGRRSSTYRSPRARTGYLPSFGAVTFNIRGGKPSDLKISSGIGTRPII